MVRVNDLRTSQGFWKSRCKWVRRVPAHPADGTQRSNAEPARVLLDAGGAPKSDQLAVHMTGEGPREFQRVSLTAAE
jgi:hypothetical protein